MGINWNAALNWVPTVSNIIACVVVGFILWRSYGHAWSRSAQVWATVGTALLGFVIYFAVHSGLEEMFPQTRINGDVVVYNINIFAVTLAVVIVAIFSLRKLSSGPSRP